MAETEDIAQQLIKFMDAEETKAKVGRPVQQYRESIAERQKDAIVEVCEKCVGRLTDEDRAHLHRILEEMLRACG
jgi:flagellar biosynthesis/type III secretory pathway protein FliH